MPSGSLAGGGASRVRGLSGVDVHSAAGIDTARQRVAAGEVVPAGRTWPGERGDRRRALPPPPPPPRAAQGRRGDAGGGSAAREAAVDTRDARRGGVAGKAAAGGGGALRSGVVSPDVDAVVAAPREGRGGGEVGSKRPFFASAAAPLAPPTPERGMDSTTRRSLPGGGRGADDGGSRLLAAPVRTGLGGSAALPKKPVAPPPRSVGEAGWSAAVVPRQIAHGGHHGQDAGALRSPEHSPRRRVAATDGFLDTESRGSSGSGKELVHPKPTMVIRRLGPGRGRVTTSQPLNKSAYKRPCTENNKSTAGGSSDYFRMRVASACTMGTINKPDDIAISILQDDGFLKKLVEHEKKLESKFNVSSDVLSAMRPRQHGTQNADARSRVQMMRERIKFICEATVKFVEQHSQKVGRIDLTADKVIKGLPGFTQHDPIIGNVPGVEIGDEFVYRFELALVGLHGPYRGGIGTTRNGDRVLVAVSIVASGGYPDKLSSSGELVYTGSGGKLAGKKDDENQKLKMGNLGLKNCIETMTPVRVIYGIKRSREEGSHPRAKRASSFVYDGLYHVVGCWKEGQPGSKVFKYKLQRIPGQPQLRYCSKTGIMC